MRYPHDDPAFGGPPPDPFDPDADHLAFRDRAGGNDDSQVVPRQNLNSALPSSDDDGLQLLTGERFPEPIIFFGRQPPQREGPLLDDMVRDLRPSRRRRPLSRGIGENMEVGKR